MRESDKYKFWNFSSGERFAVILLLCCIALLLVVRFWKSEQNSITETDFKQFEKGISDFEKQVSLKEDTVKVKKNSSRKKSQQVYHPRVQTFDPVERESSGQLEQEPDSGY